MRFAYTCLTGVALLAALTTTASAADFEVHMLNKGPDGVMVFEPVLSKISPRRYGLLHPDRQEPQCRDRQGHASRRCGSVQE